MVSPGAPLSTCHPSSQIHGPSDIQEGGRCSCSPPSAALHRVWQVGVPFPPSPETQGEAWELRGEGTYVGVSENTMKQPTRNTSVPTTAAGRSQPV